MTIRITFPWLDKSSTAVVIPSGDFFIFSIRAETLVGSFSPNSHGCFDFVCWQSEKTAKTPKKEAASRNIKKQQQQQLSRRLFVLFGLCAQWIDRSLPGFRSFYNGETAVRISLVIRAFHRVEGERKKERKNVGSLDFQRPFLLPEGLNRQSLSLQGPT